MRQPGASRQFSGQQAPAESTVKGMALQQIFERVGVPLIWFSIGYLAAVLMRKKA